MAEFHSPEARKYCSWENAIGSRWWGERKADYELEGGVGEREFAEWVLTMEHHFHLWMEDCYMMCMVGWEILIAGFMWQDNNHMLQAQKHHHSWLQHNKNEEHWS